MDKITQYFTSCGAEFLLNRITHCQESSATSELAAQCLKCECSEIAKSIAIFVKSPARGKEKRKNTQNPPVAAEGPAESLANSVSPLFPDNLFPIIIVTSGDSKILKSKFKSRFHSQLNLISDSIVENVIGYPVGGVCPFGINSNVKVYLDVSMKRFKTIHAACGTSNTIITLTLDELEEHAQNFVEWVDVCDGWLGSQG
ncbi:unnamed protein product [Phytomonas sp. Hart1]|nr:unnamed protein product [Phytomonas sp. Hart1]|eukprot:CCW68867.1 unnamed protein product [Phytomonas sp. isolate Hart1]